jgi:putative glutamine amidotransferase
VKIAIVGRKKDTKNYEAYLQEAGIIPITTLSMGILLSCDAMVLPGGGDITPSFVGEHSDRARNIDTELDIIQFHALEHCISYHIPVIGICKGLQLINLALGGTLDQDLDTASIHSYDRESDSDRYHRTRIAKDSYLDQLFGSAAIVNSAHHQGIRELGKDLTAIQWSEDDGCIEAILHTKLPVYAFQWHPERLDPARTDISGQLLLSYLTKQISSINITFR